jgi:thymidylate synthase
MGVSTNKDSGELEYTHDPCLTHDIFFIQNNKLHSFHIARAHNTVNAYPENIFGLFDAYVTTIKKKLAIKGGDMYMLSNRANILLLTEEQRLKKILAEPSKPASKINSKSGLYEINENSENSANTKGVIHMRLPMKKVVKKAGNKIIERLENFEGVDTIKKAIDYLDKKGVNHNNPILSTYQAGKSDPQDDHLVFFQSNVFGKKIYTTAVFTNHGTKNIDRDIETLNYITTKYSQKLKYPLGKLDIFYIS